VMAAFWLGTVPVLAGLGLVAQRAIAPLRARLPAISSAALILVGLLTITGKFHPLTAASDCRHMQHMGTMAPAAPGAAQDHDHR
jgi:hypothetical protein